MKHLPNSITALRIIGAFVLFFIEPLSAPFYTIYTLCGFTDILDGFIARRLNLTSELGAKLDSVADLIFYGAMILNILPDIFNGVSIYAWIFAAVVLLTRIISYIWAAVKYHRFSSLHTYGNKISGFVVFCIPYLIQFTNKTFVCLLACAVCALASADELTIHIKRTDYKANAKTFFIDN